VRAADFDDTPMVVDFAAPSQPKRSIIKKESAIRPSHEIEQAKAKKEGKALARKVHFADLQFIDDVDDYIRNEEKSY
jgi:hypothetical protein